MIYAKNELENKYYVSVEEINDYLYISGEISSLTEVANLFMRCEVDFEFTDGLLKIHSEEFSDGVGFHILH